MSSPRQFLATLTRTRLSLIGTVLTTASALLFITLMAFELMGMHSSPYMGILAFIIVPVLFVVGLVLIPFGLWLDRRRRRKSGDTGPLVVDLESSRTKRQIRIFIAATLVNVAIVMIAALKGVEVMETDAFCGQTCHSVMAPEFTAYQRSPHARVGCVACHIGEGASWFVKSKLAGSWQVVSVALDLYPRPIKTPIHNLRPARETCERCHWPEKFVGERLKVISRFQDDEVNTELKTVMMLKVGGALGEKSHGIHWHVDPGNTVRYRSDPTRETIYEVEAQVQGKPARRFLGPDAEKPEASQATTWRTMDCVDCHNRPTHIYLAPEEELDRALADGRLDKTLPFVRREALKALKVDYPSHDAARAGIQQALAAFYTKDHPAVGGERVALASKTLGDIYATNVYPQMKITWGTYKNQLGHMTDPGCLRCHGGDHKAADGETISADCETCHNILAEGEADPEILKTLRP